jgi:hypothetical protein
VPRTFRPIRAGETRSADAARASHRDPRVNQTSRIPHQEHARLYASTRGEVEARAGPGKDDANRDSAAQLPRQLCILPGADDTAMNSRSTRKERPRLHTNALPRGRRRRGARALPGSLPARSGVKGEAMKSGL